MTRTTRWLVFVISTPLVFLVAVGGLIGARAAAPEPAQQGFAHLRVFEDVVSLIVSSYVEEIDVDPVMDGAMRGLADSLDAESAYLTPSDVRALDAGDTRGTADIGVVVARQFYLRAVGVRDESPAARVGLRSGDFIRMIDGTPTRDMSAWEGARRLSGVPGSSVELVVIRTNAADPHRLRITREVAPADPASATRANGTPLVRVRSFGPATADDIRKDLGAIGAAGSAPVVIDLRGIADGTAAAGVAAARLFVTGGPLATSAGRDGARTVMAGEAGDGALAMPVILLVSNGTAHAAEIFAAALRDHGRARLVGEPTAGLAGEQKLFRLPGGHGLWMTHLRYLTADGALIHGQGLEPDEPVAIPIVEFGETPPAADAVLDRALELARSPRPIAG